MPFLEELAYIPTEKYAHAQELFEHAQNIGRHYGLYSKALFETEVHSLRWRSNEGLWDVETDCSDTILARWIILCPGNTATPKLPGCSGIEKFQGASFHTSRWDYKFTGGCHEGKLDGLEHKRVGIIGTGASAVQVLPKVAASAKGVFVFQRTPSSISPRNNCLTDPTWSSLLKPGWQKERMQNFQAVTSGAKVHDLVQDAWTEHLPKIAGAMIQAHIQAKDSPQQSPKASWDSSEQMVDYEIMEKIRQRVDRIVRNPETAAALKPWYNFLCKRPCFHDEFLQAFNQPNVALVETHGKGIDDITETGVVANGRDFPLDCIVFATGFEWQTEWNRRTGIHIYGKDGIELSTKWKDGISTFHGWGVNGFPNLLLITHAQSGLSVNYTHSALAKCEHLMDIIKTCEDRGYRSVEPSEAAEKEWVDHCVTLGESRKHFLSDCIPGYLNNEGDVDDKVTRSNPYPAGEDAYQQALAAWREEGKLSGLLIDEF